MAIDGKFRAVKCVLSGGPCDGMDVQAYAGSMFLSVPSDRFFYRYRLRGSLETPQLSKDGKRIFDHDRTVSRQSQAGK